MDGKLSYNPYRLFLFLLCWSRLVGNQQRNITSTYLASSLLGEWTHCVYFSLSTVFRYIIFLITMLCSQFIGWMCTKTDRWMWHKTRKRQLPSSWNLPAYLPACLPACILVTRIIMVHTHNWRTQIASYSFLVPWISTLVYLLSEYLVLVVFLSWKPPL